MKQSNKPSLLSPETVSSLSQEDLEELKNKAFEKVSGSHTWRQRGVWLVCTSCDNQHAQFIGTKKMLIGIEDGKPVLIDV
jgi:hypothetical protein